MIEKMPRLQKIFRKKAKKLGRTTVLHENYIQASMCRTFERMYACGIKPGDAESLTLRSIDLIIHMETSKQSNSEDLVEFIIELYQKNIGVKMKG